MGKLEDLIKKAKNYDDVAMLEIVDMFQPVVRKYSRMMNHDEDIASELVLALIELVHNIRLDKLDAPNDYVLISYIGRSLYHKYIYVSQKRCAVVNCEASYEDDAELERASYTSQTALCTGSCTTKAPSVWSGSNNLPRRPMHTSSH